MNNFGEDKMSLEELRKIFTKPPKYCPKCNSIVFSASRSNPYQYYCWICMKMVYPKL